jgi:dipeptidyl aminopeptidase/acylaminoacyl peptidase
MMSVLGFGRTSLFKVWLLAAATLLAACLLVLVGIEKAAEAAFPGVNGKIAFISSRDGNNEIYIMDGDGSNQTRLTNNSADDRAPAWSADGSKIAFRSSRDGNGEIYAMGSDGTNRTNLTNNPALDDFPDWGPTTADTTLPILELPEDIIVNATTADGAQVTFDVSATDNTDPNPVVNCSPVSGSAFPIETTPVTCTATDSSGNKVSGSFSVTLKGATDQISDLKVLVTSLALPAGTTTSLQAKLNEALSAANGGDTASACTALNDFISQVRAHAGKKKLSAQDAQDLIAEAQRIQAVLGC